MRRWFVIALDVLSIIALFILCVSLWTDDQTTKGAKLISVTLILVLVAPRIIDQIRHEYHRTPHGTVTNTQS